MDEDNFTSVSSLDDMSLTDDMDPSLLSEEEFDEQGVNSDGVFSDDDLQVIDADHQTLCRSHDLFYTSNYGSQ